MEDKIGRRSIRVMDLASEKNLDSKLETVLIHHNAIRKRLGKEGREWAINKSGLTSEAMAERAINAIDKLFNTWIPREKYELINVNKIKEDTIKHEFLY